MFKFDIVLSECAFSFALLPWDNLYLFYGLSNLREIFSNNNADSNGKKSSRVILPFRIRFKAIAVSMENLDKIRSPVGITEGFDIGEFDKIILVNY
jgi:protein arginine N-methyltransferase 7